MSNTLIGDRYELRDRLGSGGMGDVFRAQDTRLLRDVAIKILKNAGDSEEALFYFHREARAVAALRHPGIVQIFDYSGPDETPPYIVMDLLEGGNLIGMLTPLFPLAEPAILAVAESMSRALLHAHQHGVVHRDIKPANIMLEPSGRIALTDFGLAKAYQNPLQLGGTLANRATRLFGTPDFLAPEQIERSESGPETDVFALGSVIYWLTAGTSAFADTDAVACMQRVVSANCRDLREARPYIDREVYELVADCHAHETFARPKPAAIAERCRAWRRERGLAGPAEILELLLTHLEENEEATRPYGMPNPRRDTHVDDLDFDDDTEVLPDSGEIDHPRWAAAAPDETDETLMEELEEEETATDDPTLATAAAQKRAPTAVAPSSPAPAPAPARDRDRDPDQDPVLAPSPGPRAVELQKPTPHLSSRDSASTHQRSPRGSLFPILLIAGAFVVGVAAAMVWLATRS